MVHDNSFTVADWTVFSAFLIISSCIGVYHALAGGKQETTKEFLMGNRNMTILPVATSILVSFLSAILILGAPAEMYTRGTQYYLYVFGQMAAVVIATVLFVPLFYPLKLTSMYQYIELRFKSRSPRLTATFINILASLVYTGIASFAPATALQAVTGFPEWASFLLIGFVCTFYTFMGGFKAVIWVDAFQALIMFGGLLTIVIKATIEVGGFEEVWYQNEKWNRINFWNFDFDPTVRHTFWALTIGGMINWIGTFGASQQSIQRFSSLPSLRQAKIAVLLNCLGLFIMVTSACLAGISVFAFYAIKGCDPYKNGDIKNPNQIIPTFVMEVLQYPGVPGLFIAGLFSGALSSISSNLSSLVATSWEDIIKPHVQHLPEKTHAWITRFLVVFFGAVGIGVSFAVRKLGGTVLQVSLSFMGAASGALNGFVVLGAFFPCCNWIGAMAGPLTSYAVMMWIGIAKYSVLGVKDRLDFPLNNCPAKNISGITNLTSSPMYNTFLPLTFGNGTNSYHSSILTTPISAVRYNGSISNLSLILSNIVVTTGAAPAASSSEMSGLHRLYSLSYLWYSTLGIIISVVVGVVVSYLTGPMDAKDIDPKYLVPVFRQCCFYLPDSVKKFLRCDVRYPNQEYQSPSSAEESIDLNSSSKLVTNQKHGSDVDTKHANNSNIQLLSIESLTNDT